MDTFTGAVVLAPLLTFIDKVLYHFYSLFCHYNPVEQDEIRFHIIIHWLFSINGLAQLLQVSKALEEFYFFRGQRIDRPSCSADSQKVS